MNDFNHSLWAKEIERAYINARRFGRGYYRLPPLTRWQRIKYFLKFYEARRRIGDAWLVLRGKARIE